MSVLELEVYDILKLKFGEKEAAKFIEFIDAKTSSKVEAKSDIFDQIVQKDIARLEDRFNTKLSELNIRISEAKAELIKWMFIFWASQMDATVGFIILYLKR